MHVSRRLYAIQSQINDHPERASETEEILAPLKFCMARSLKGSVCVTQESDRRVHITLAERPSSPPLPLSFRHLSLVSVPVPPGLISLGAALRVEHTRRSRPLGCERHDQTRAVEGSTRFVGLAPSRGHAEHRARPDREANFLLSLGVSQAPPSDARRRRRGARGRARRATSRAPPRGYANPAPNPTPRARPRPPRAHSLRHFPRNAACQHSSSRPPARPAANCEENATHRFSIARAGPRRSSDALVDAGHTADARRHPRAAPAPAHAQEEAPHLVSRRERAARGGRGAAQIAIRGSEVDVASLAGDGGRGERRG